MRRSKNPLKKRRGIIVKDKTSLSCIWQLRLFGRDFIFGWIKITEAAELGEDNANILLKR